MARALHRLTAIAVAKQKKPGAYADGGGLWLQVTASGSKSWSFRFMLAGRAREMGLGPLHTVELAKARDKARACRELLLEGLDPIEHRKADRARQSLEGKRNKSFDECAAAYVAAKRAGWSNEKHAGQWANTLKTYVSPIFGGLSVRAVATEDIMQALTPIWTTKTETATRVRQRIEAVLDWAAATGLRSGENPARWGGHLEYKLAKPSKVRKVENLPALPFAQVAQFMVELQAQKGVAARALEFTILTASRTGEVRGATWAEIDIEHGTWTIPAERMKMRREHRVPLCARAVAIVEELAQFRSEGDSILFPGGTPSGGLSDGALLALLRRMKRSSITPHGFRSTFRDWASEKTAYAHEVQEMALAHVIKNKAEAAYRRGDLFEKRRSLMEEWAAFCNSSNEVENSVPHQLVG